MVRIFKKQIISALLVSLIFCCSTQLIDVSMGNETVQQQRQASDTEVLWNAFAVTGAKLSDLELNAWAMQPKAMNEQEIRNVLDRLAAKLDVKNNKLTETEENYSGYYSLKRDGMIDKNIRIEIGAESLNFSDQDVCKPETYIIVNYYCKHPVRQSVYWETRINKCLQSMGYQANITTCYTGIINKRLDSIQKNKLTEKVFTKLQAKKVEGVTDNNLVSLTGVSPLLHNQIQVGAKDINFNLALRYDRLYHQTHVIIASPLITTGY